MFKKVQTITVIDIRYDKQEILNSEAWINWNRDHPQLSSQALIVLDELSDWIEKGTSNFQDIYYDPDLTFPQDGSWEIDHSTVSEADAMKQMGTTGIKFSISSCLKQNLRKSITTEMIELAKLFKILGFICFYGFYQDWRLGHDYSFLHIDHCDREDIEMYNSRSNLLEAHIFLSIPFSESKSTLINKLGQKEVFYHPV